MHENYITRTFSGPEVGEVVSVIGKVLEDVDPMLVLSACLAMSILISRPEATTEELEKGVMGVSEWIALYAESLDPEANQVVN